MKKLFALFMTLCVSVALVGCGEAKKEEPKKGGAAPAAPAKPAGGEEKK
jgi:hypothetical protein